MLFFNLNAGEVRMCISNIIRLGGASVTGFIALVSTAEFYNSAVNTYACTYFANVFTEEGRDKLAESFFKRVSGECPKFNQSLAVFGCLSFISTIATVSLISRVSCLSKKNVPDAPPLPIVD